MCRSVLQTAHARMDGGCLYALVLQRAVLNPHRRLQMLGLDRVLPGAIVRFLLLCLSYCS